jgi:hypothetical protein
MVGKRVHYALKSINEHRRPIVTGAKWYTRRLARILGFKCMSFPSFLETPKNDVDIIINGH